MNKIEIMNIGDYVKVIDTGKTYTRFQSLARKLKISNWDTGKLPSINNIFQIMNIFIESRFIYNIAYIKENHTGKGYLIEIKGLKLFLIDFIKKDEMIL